MRPGWNQPLPQPSEIQRSSPWSHEHNRRNERSKIPRSSLYVPKTCLLGLPRFLPSIREVVSGAFHGFEIETEIAMHTADIGLPYDEYPTPYRSRHADTKRKLRTLPDGLRVLVAAILVSCPRGGC
jgi:hypothetical protein